MLKITWCQRGKLSLGNLQSHFPRRAPFLIKILPKLKPPPTFDLYTRSQLTLWSLLLSPTLDQRKSLYNFSILKATRVGILKREEIVRNVRQTGLRYSNSTAQWQKSSFPSYPISVKFCQSQDPKKCLPLDSPLMENTGRIRANKRLCI